MNTITRRVVPTMLVATVSALPSLAQKGTADYELTFTSTWSAVSHPINFPSNPHYSPLVGGTHTAAVNFWQPGSLASLGIERMAEQGQTATLSGEIDSAIIAGTANQVLTWGGGGAMPFSPDTISVQFRAYAEFPLLTMVAMLAPSPDWFVGVHDLALIQNGDWVDDLVITLHGYDAGTDNGVSYSSPDLEAVPHLPIATITTASGPFQGASTVVGTFTLNRLSSTVVYGCGVNAPGALGVSGTAEPGQTLFLSIAPPSGQWTPPAVTGLALSNNPPAAFPCGTLLPGFGLVAGAPGEALLGTIDAIATGPTWNGGTTTVLVPLPNQTNLIGARFYLQTFLAGPRVGLTDGLLLHIGG